MRASPMLSTILRSVSRCDLANRAAILRGERGLLRGREPKKRTPATKNRFCPFESGSFGLHAKAAGAKRLQPLRKFPPLMTELF